MKSQILVESKTARQQMLRKVSVLDMLGKPVPMLTNDGRSTIKQTAEWFEVPENTINSIIKRNREEFSVDGIEVLPARKVKTLILSDVHSVPHKKAATLTLLPKQAILRIGMMLTESKMATKLRDILFKGEQELTYHQKTRAVREAEKWEAQREAAKIVRRVLTDAIDHFIAESPHKKWKYKHFTDLAYKGVFGQSTKGLRLSRGAADIDSLRDGLTVDELKALERAEMFIAGQIMAGDSYESIKSKIRNIDFWLKPARTA